MLLCSARSRFCWPAASRPRAQPRPPPQAVQQRSRPASRSCDIRRRLAAAQSTHNGDHHRSIPEQHAFGNPDHSCGMAIARDHHDQRLHIFAVARIPRLLARCLMQMRIEPVIGWQWHPNVKGTFNSGCANISGQISAAAFLQYYLGTMQGGVHVVGPMTVPPQYSQWAQGLAARTRTKWRVARRPRCEATTQRTRRRCAFRW